MGIEEKLPSGILLTTVEKLVNWARKSSIWRRHLRSGLLRHRDDGHRRGRTTTSAASAWRSSGPRPRQADLMIVAGRVSQKMAPVLRQIYDQMPEPKWVLSMGVCASSGGMFNNYAIVQGVDHIVPVDMYLPGCPPRPEMLIDAILKLHEKIMHEPLGADGRKMLEARTSARRRAGRGAGRDAVVATAPTTQRAPEWEQAVARGPRGAAADRELDEADGRTCRGWTLVTDDAVERRRVR